MEKLMLKNVRLSFPSLFKRAVFDGKEGKFEATFLLSKEKDAAQIATLEKYVQSFLDEKFGAGKAPKSVKRSVITDGDTKDYDGYGGMIAVKAGTNSRPTVIDRDKSPLAADDGKPYAGCYVNAVVSLWYSDHPLGGKQVLANLHGVQFVKDGEAFGAGNTDCTDEFDDIFGDDDEI